VASELTILHRCERLCAVDKPAGMVVHRSEWCPEGEPVLQRLRDQIGRRVWPVHRLDRATSGVLLFALDAEAARAISVQFEQHTVDKRYHAIVRGWSDTSGIVDSPLREHPDAPEQAAHTEYRRMGRIDLPIAVGRYASARYSWVEARPRTGRMHQLRRHFAHLRHPVVGDVRHGDGRHNRMFREQLALPGMMLRSVWLRLRDLDERELAIAAPSGGATGEALARLAWTLDDHAVAPPSITST
jgi:tRNA pseudouridine65 synthase